MVIDVDIYIILMILLGPLISFNLYKVDTTEKFGRYFIIAFIFMLLEIVLLICHLMNCSL